MAVIGELNQLPDLPENLKLIQRIGRGGAGDVFAVQDVTGKRLAFKRINTNWQQTEFESISTLRTLPAHPALTQIFHAGVLPQGDFYYTMELADNAGDDRCYIADTLAYRMLNRKIPLDEICRILADAVEGARHLHVNGLFHGDIKPENIIFVNGQVKLADFGTVKSPESAGTPGFSPDNPQSGTDCDCYAVCKILYCAWSGLDESMYPSFPEEFVPSELKLVRRIYLDGCSDNAHRRFRSAVELKEALQNCLEQLNRTQSGSLSRVRMLKTAAWGLVVLAALAGAFAVGIFVRNSGLYSSAVKTEPDAQEKLLQTREYRRAMMTVERSLEVGDDYRDIRPMRKIFETVFRSWPEKLDKDKVRDVQNFYRDMDRLHEIRQQLLSEKITQEEFLDLYNDTRFAELYESVYTRSFEPDQDFVGGVLYIYYTWGNDLATQD